ncbi:MAG: hypothetical protein LBJ00_02435 [Planctomycetaceae bacterium]|nr:hypothetical protein [Planctomycetaceae bacterium]
MKRLFKGAAYRPTDYGIMICTAFFMIDRWGFGDVILSAKSSLPLRYVMVIRFTYKNENFKSKIAENFVND